MLTPGTAKRDPAPLKHFKLLVQHLYLNCLFIALYMLTRLLGSAKRDTGYMNHGGFLEPETFFFPLSKGQNMSIDDTDRREPALACWHESII